MSEIDLSIIIVNWNAMQLTRQCLQSVFEQTKNVKFEVIVIDNGSADLSCQMIRTEFPQVVLIDNPQNRGFAAANNQGIAISKGEFVLLLNNDTIVLDNAIEKTLCFAKSNPQAAAVACKVLNADGTFQSACFMFPSIVNLALAAAHLDKIFPNNRFLGRERYAKLDWDQINEVDVIAGCFMLVRQEAIQQVGALDKRFFMYAEETDWCCRFRKAGWKILYSPVAQIIHLRGASSDKVKAEMMLQLRGSILLFIKKHRSRFSYAVACWIICMYFLMRAPCYSIKNIFAKNKPAAQRLDYACWKGALLSLLGANYLCLKR